jgi:type III secretion system (T3SS) SseB-like protein
MVDRKAPPAVHRLEVVGEQDGPPERRLKRRLVELFRSRETVERAFLARVAYESQSDVNVALCIRSLSEPDVRLVEEIGNIFGRIFGRHEHLDIIFVDVEMERQLESKCRPFFRSESPDRG